MQRKRAKERDIDIPPVADPHRRLHAESSPFRFLETYFADRFGEAMTDDRRLIVDQIHERARLGGDKAIAAPRGEGKTSFAECVVGVEAIFTGLLRFPLICTATGPDSDRILSNIKAEYEFNEKLIADYPEICAPIVALEGAPQRCNMQTYRGERTRLKWSGNHIILPTIHIVAWCPRCFSDAVVAINDGCRCLRCKHEYQEWVPKSAGSIVASRGLDGSVRGLRYGNLRPDFVFIDDAETRESAKSPTQIETREKTIDEDLAGLGGSRKPVARLFLCTIMNTQCLSAKYTDRNQKPSWDGDRLALVRRWPDRKDLWEHYIELRQNGMQNDPPDKHGREAHAFYVEHRDEMDAGAIVSNPLRFSADKLDDGTERELSTIQHVHNAAADKGWNYVFNELQNDPQEEEVSETDQLTVGIIAGSHQNYRGRLNGLDVGIVPEAAQFLTATVDVQHDKLYLLTTAWLPGNRRAIVDYRVFGDDITDRATTETLTIRRLRALKANLDAYPYQYNGMDRQPDAVLVDASDGTLSGVIYSTCMELGWVPFKGSGRFSKPKGDTTNRTADPWYLSTMRHERKTVKLCVFDSETFRQRSRETWLEQCAIPSEMPVTLFGASPTEHKAFGSHLAVRYERTYDEKKGWREQWVEPKRHDWWDCDVASWAAVSIARQAKAAADRPQRKYGVLSTRKD